MMQKTFLDQLNGLSEAEREQWLARFSLELASAQHVYNLSDEERAMVREGLADLDAGRIVSGSDMAAFWNRNRRA